MSQWPVPVLIPTKSHGEVWMLLASSYSFSRICGISHEEIMRAALQGTDYVCERHVEIVLEVLKWCEDRDCQIHRGNNDSYTIVFPSQDIAALFRLTFYR